MNENQKRLQNAPTADNEIYVGPNWIRSGDYKVNELLDDAGTPPRRLTSDQIVERAERRKTADEKLLRSFWWMFVPGVIGLGLAGYLLSILLEALK
jgi:hypothetical protein